ncbi:hypothetical protein SAMN05660748_2944 [Blastococcus aggregatus]|uniref:Heavy-metal-associated domain-containing protein n=1 Tax=Blastococcus aggregatus TaxID=38502 RepID=A0A285V858_9ACTN|nr:hypothetical protein [Blastococcus aggregatus]SOC50203.1 hypothetical protein SAMN05660748_2944 [Blastococcus aggregatus]
MNTPVKLAAFGVGLVAVFGAATGLGAVVGPVGPAAEESSAAGHDMGGTAGHDDDAGPATDAHLPAGLAVSEDGYTLALDQPTLPAGAAIPLAFRVLGPGGVPLTDYALRHDEDLHLVAVRRDLTGYQHMHPDLGADGVWRVPLDLSPGSWRVFADFAAGADGEDRVLGADLSVAGEYSPEPLPDPAAVAEVDGYTVVLDGSLTAGEESELRFGISRDGVPVTDLQPYLGAFGHLVALRSGDLGYLHVHPADPPGGAAPAPGPNIAFVTTAPSAGSYRLFLDFRHGDVVRTAAFTVTVGAHEEHGS